MLDELTKSIKAQLYDRARSPLTGAFAISWSIWNFPSIVIFFSDLKFDEKMGHWEKIYQNGPNGVFQLVVIPLISTVLFILFYPYAARWAFHYWHWQHRETKKIQQKIEDETPLTQEEAAELRKKSIEELTHLQEELRKAATANVELTNRNREYLEKVSASQNELEKAQAEVETLKNEVAKARQESGAKLPNEETAGKSEKEDRKWPDVEFAILTRLGDFENNGVSTVDDKMLMNALDGDVVSKRFALGNLVASHLIANNGLGYALTHSGRGALKKAH